MNDSRKRRLLDKSSGPASLITDGCKISGVLTGTGDYHVSGEIDGDCEIEGTITLDKSGFWSGTIHAGNVIIAGHVEGDIVASGSVEITDTARITGTVSGEAIAVAEGAVVEGVMKTTGRVDLKGFVEKRHED